MAAGPVAAVVAECDRLRQCNIQTKGPGGGRGDLGDFERVGEPGPLMVVREDEDLGLPGEPPERRGVKDPVPVPLEACPPGVGLLRAGAVTGSERAGCAGSQCCRLEVLPLGTRQDGDFGAEAGMRVGVGNDQAGCRRMAGHGRCPPPAAFRRVFRCHFETQPTSGL
jgi:hypothetical protein